MSDVLVFKNIVHELHRRRREAPDALQDDSGALFLACPRAGFPRCARGEQPRRKAQHDAPATTAPDHHVAPARAPSSRPFSRRSRQPISR